jgi:hypothetical protein
MTTITTGFAGGQSATGHAALHNATGAQVNLHTGNVFNVKDTSYGALGDGATDDAAAINLAITAAGNNTGGGVVFFPPGTYLIRNNLTITKSNVFLVGVQGYSTVKLGATVNKIPIVFAVGSVIQHVGVIGLEVDGSYSTQTIVNSDTGGAAWNVAYAVGTPERTQNGLYGIAFRDCYDVTVKDCFIHDTLNSGIQFNQCGIVKCTQNYLASNGMVRATQNAHYAQPCNGISVIGKPTSLTGEGHRIIGNDIYNSVDVGIDIHCIESKYVVCNSNIVHGRGTTSNGASGWGIVFEKEGDNTADDLGASFSGNYVADMNIAYGCSNSNATRFIYNCSFTGNVAYNCTTFFSPFGKYITFTGNSGYNLSQGVTSNNITAGTHGYWSFCGNSIHISSSSADSSAFHMRAQANVTLQNIAITGNTAVGQGASVARSCGLLIDSFGASSVVENITASNNVFNSFNSGFQINATAGTTRNNKLYGNHTQGNASYGLDVSGGTGLLVEGGSVAGTAGATNGITATNTTSVRNVAGLNDTLATAALTPSGSPYTPAATHRDSMINVTGGTVSAITVAGLATALTSGSFWIPANKQITITYSVAPTVQQISY